MAASLEHYKDTISCHEEFSENESLSEGHKYRRYEKNNTPPRGGKKTSGIVGNLQDRLVDKILQMTNLMDEDLSFRSKDPKEPESPSFSIPTMSNNFRHFNARIGVVFVIQKKLTKLLAWKSPTHTLSFLAIYTFVCLDPYLITVLPSLILLALLILSYIARHPEPKLLENSPSKSSLGSFPSFETPAKEQPKDFFRNMRDLQNSMEDFSRSHDQIKDFAVPFIEFSNEPLSSTLFLFSFLTTLFMFVASRLVPWRLVFTLLGWIVTCSGHPIIHRQTLDLQKKYFVPLTVQAKDFLETWISQDFINDSTEIREVEIFEIQHRSSIGEWEPWLFSSVPFHSSLNTQIDYQNRMGTHHIEEVQPPSGWQWNDENWALDLWSQDWVEDRVTSGVEIETEGERWVYDTCEYHPESGMDTMRQSNNSTAKENQGFSDSNEDTNSIIAQRKRRGDWRRRRWVRLVRRICSNGTHMA